LKKNFIIHVGFHKTGTSSIQACFSQLDMPDHEYLKWGHANHSAMFHQAFAPQDKYNPAHPVSQLSKEDYKCYTGRFRQKLRHSIEATTKRNLIISGEGLSKKNSSGGLRELLAIIKKYADKITCIAYVRPVDTLLSSVFQQRLKSGFRDKFPPNVRSSKRIGNLIDIFGRDRLILRKFSKPDLIGGDVVGDFARLINVKIPDHVIKHENQSIPLEAIALLYVHIKYFYKEIRPLTDAKIHLSVSDILKNLGSTEFRFSPELITKVKQTYKKDTAQIEKWLGVSMNETTQNVGGISNLNELEKVAVEQLPVLEKLLDQLYLTSKADRELLETGIAAANSEKSLLRRVAHLVEAIKTVETKREGVVPVQIAAHVQNIIINETQKVLVS